MGNTEKVFTAGRYGARYGVGIRKRLLKIETQQQKYYNCPFCGSKKVRRKAAGLFACRKCAATFAGGAYIPVTLSGSIVQKMVGQKEFLPRVKELLSAKESAAEGEKRAFARKNEQAKREGHAGEYEPGKPGHGEKHAEHATGRQAEHSARQKENSDI